jgi:integrase
VDMAGRHSVTTWALKTYPTKVDHESTRLNTTRIECSIVSEMLGHSNVRTTLDIYGHVLQGDFEAPLAEMARKLVPVVA